jgi:hypothetical protein
MVLADRAPEIFEGVHPSPYMLFVHRVRPDWVDRIPAVVHVDGTARIQSVDDRTEPLVAAVSGRGLSSWPARWWSTIMPWTKQGPRCRPGPRSA